jgi:DNA-binding transcriptional LysR family regulator
MDVSAIELSHLRYFAVLAEELHFGRAAARLHMAQPPLTRQIQMLEARLACRLFERNSRSTRLTVAGAQLAERARSILAAADQAFGALERMGRGEAGQLTLATAPSLMLGALPQSIRRFRRKYPDVEFRLTEMASSAILDAVQVGTADVGLLRGADRQAGIETYLRWQEPMVAILPPGPAAIDARAVLKQLRSQPFVLFPRQLGPAFYDEVMSYCKRMGAMPVVAQEARQWSSILSLVSAGMGVSIGPESVATLLPKTVRCVPLAGFRTAVRLVGRRGASNSAVANFLAIARQHYPAAVSAGSR